MSFNKGIALLYYQNNLQQLRYKLGACKNNSRSLTVKLNNRFPRRFLLMSCHQGCTSKTYLSSSRF